MKVVVSKLELVYPIKYDIVTLYLLNSLSELVVIIQYFGGGHILMLVIQN